MPNHSVIFKSIMSTSKESRGRILEGIIGINKPTGPSSAQVLNDVQDHFTSSNLFAPWLDRERSRREVENTNQKKRRRGFHRDIKIKIGHGGTLDPLATGVLITGIGSGTKELNNFSNHCNKSYETVVLFGAATDTYDCLGKIVGRAPYAHISESLVRDKLASFKGKMLQRPPIFSAIKQDGKPLYEYAREGKRPPRDIEKREVEVLEMEMLEWMEPGSHDHKWPEEEASAEEKRFAEMLLGVADTQGREDMPVVNTAQLSEESKEEAKDKSDIAGARYPSSPTPKADTTTEPIGHQPPVPTVDSASLLSSPTLMSGAISPPPPATPDPTTSSSHPPAARIRMTVTSGFYVRSLCHDLGAACSSLALMSSLVRTRQGFFETGKNVLDFEDLEKGETVWGPKVREMLEKWEEGAEARVREEKKQGQRDGAGNGRVKEEKGGQKRSHENRERGGRGDRGPPPEKRRRERNSSSDVSS